MATQVTNYQCPACTAPLHFSAESGKLTCEFCDSTYSVAEIEALYAEKNEAAAAAEQSEGAKAMHEELWGEGAEHMRAYSCPSCGAELICDDTTAATSCPYCGNPTVVPGQFAGTKRPDYVIPFKLTKEDAIAALKQHCAKKPLLPKAFTKENHIQEIKGVYVPFWLFDGIVNADVHFAATRRDVEYFMDDEIVYTHYYDVRRAGFVSFEKVPADGSSKMPDAYMDAIEPYDYSELQPFAMAYLPGYLANKYDVPADDAFARVRVRMENSAVDAMAAQVFGYDSAATTTRDTNVQRMKTAYGLMPVWMLSTKYMGKNFLFAVNGQTGKMVGELPVSRGRFFGWFAGIAAGCAAVLSTVLALMV